MLTTDQKGAIAEMAIAWEATRLGIEVYRPITEGGRFDMIFLVGDDLARVQCKWAPRQGDVIVGFSSRGPGGDWLKPDLSAPGAQILAGNTPVP